MKKKKLTKTPEQVFKGVQLLLNTLPEKTALIFAYKESEEKYCISRSGRPSDVIYMCELLKHEAVKKQDEANKKGVGINETT